MILFIPNIILDDFGNIMVIILNLQYNFLVSRGETFLEIKFEFHYMISLFRLVMYTSSHHVELETHILILRRYELQVLDSLRQETLIDHSSMMWSSLLE